MNFRPAGYSSDEDECEFENFSFHGETKTAKERRNEIAAEIYQDRIDSENTASNRVYNAILKHNLDDVIKEINNGFDINSDIFDGWTALFLSIQESNVIIVEALLKNGADIHKTRDDNTLLMAICSRSKSSSVTSDIVVKIVNILIEYGIDVNAVDRKRRTAFMFACSQGFVEVVKLLLPLSEIEAKDNQGWTGLFYAVNKNEYDVAKLLIEEGANIEHVDVRNNDITYYAVVNDNEALLSLLPKNDFDISPEDFANEICDYEAEFKSLRGAKPDFKSDISSLLYGMRCQHFIPKFNKTNIDLVTFLTLTEDKIKDFDVKLSFERNRIMQGLHNFHAHTWKKSSIPFVPPKEMFTTYNIFVTIVNTVKHLTVLEGTILYLANKINLSGTVFDQKMVTLKLAGIKKKVDRLKFTIIKLHSKALMMDTLYPGPADLITSKSIPHRTTLKKKVAIGFALIVVFRLIKTQLI